MTPEALKQQLLAEEVQNPKYRDLADWEVASVLHKPDPTLPAITELVPKMAGPGVLMETIGAEEGATLLDSLVLLSQISSPVKWAMKLIVDKDGIDVASTTFREQLDMLVQNGKISDTSAAKIKALAEVTRHPSWAEYNQVEVTPRTVGLARGGK
jgi:hypothetical protein